MSNPSPADAAQPVHHAILDQAKRNPGNIAVVTDEAVITYGQLLERACSLAGMLRLAGVGPGTPVASCLARSSALPVALLGIWLAGGAYVPLAPDCPARRLEYMLRDSNPVAVVTTEDIARSLSTAV